MCVSDKFKDKIDVPFWEKVHTEYMTGVKISEVEAKYGIASNAMTYYFSKLGLPRRHKNKALLLSQGLKACSNCKEVQSLSNFTIAQHKTKGGDIKTSPSSWCKGCISKKDTEKRDRLRGKPKELPAIEKGFKQCPRCKETKDISEYSIYVNKKGHKRVHSNCKECCRLASLTANMKQENLERKRERDRIRAKTEENKERRNEATRRYQQSDKGKDYRNERAKKQREDKILKLIGSKCDLIHVDCKQCNSKQIKRLDNTKGDGYTTICTKCLSNGARGRNKIKEAPCYKCGLMHVAKSYKSQCSNCKAESNREHNREARKKRKGLPRHTQYRKRARLYGVKYEPVNKIKVFERDEYKCYLCGIDVVISEKYRPDQATIDHVIAMANGGEHTYSNVKTCCHACNSKKGDR